MIRINLLPQSGRRRRRRRPGRELPIAVLVLVSVALLAGGALWIAATEADSAALRRDTEVLTREIKAVRAGFDATTLVARKQALQVESAAQEQLRAGRRTPARLLAALGPIVAAGDPAAVPDESPFAGRSRNGPLWLDELREAAAGRWALTASAVDLATLTGLLRRLRASEQFAAVAPAEYVRQDGRLTLRVMLVVRE